MWNFSSPGHFLEEEVGEMFLQYLVKLWLLFVNSKNKTRNGKKPPNYSLFVCVSLVLLAGCPYQK